MIDNPNQALSIVSLNPDLLVTPFEVHTNWHVITGAPCSGKSTMIDLLARSGYQTAPEVGRNYIEMEIVKGRTLDEIRADTVGFSRVIIELTLARERKLRPEELIFHDRGIPDCLGFYRLLGLDLNEILPNCFHYRYASVFILDRFPTKKDCARIEDDIEADFLDTWHDRDYRCLGYSVVRVPILSPDERLAFILGRISGLT